jgi:hypothetical protein
LKQRTALVLIFGCFILENACSTFQAGIYVLTLDYNGKEVLSKEGEVKKHLEEILISPDKYIMSAYTRRALAAHIKRTPLIFHSFYVITSDKEQFFTLSFSATEKTFYSEGSWVINSETDVSSYNGFRYGSNEWEVKEIPIGRGINTERTIKNILYKIDSNVTYYYNDHADDKVNKENCNTALQNTLTENN